MNISINRATEIEDKYAYKTMGKYEWLDDEKKVYETKIVDKNKNP